MKKTFTLFTAAIMLVCSLSGCGQKVELKAAREALDNVQSAYDAANALVSEKGTEKDNAEMGALYDEFTKLKAELDKGAADEERAEKITQSLNDIRDAMNTVNTTVTEATADAAAEADIAAFNAKLEATAQRISAAEKIAKAQGADAVSKMIDIKTAFSTVKEDMLKSTDGVLSVPKVARLNGLLDTIASDLDAIDKK